MSERAEAALVALCFAGAACQGPPRNVENLCVPDWPAPAAAQPAAPLAGVTPALLWRTPITLATANDWILATDTRVALSAGGRLYLLDHDGNYLGGRTSAAFERISSAVADEQGNFYFVGQSVYGVDADGRELWPLVPLDGVRYDAPNAGRTIALGPDHTLYAGASDGAVYAIDTANGSRRFRFEVMPGEGTPQVAGGVGGALLVLSRAAEPKAQLWDARAGTRLARWPTAEGERFGLMFGATLGIVTQRMEDHAGPYPWMDIAVLDMCSREKWSIDARRAQWPSLIGFDDRLYVVERDDVEGSPTFVSVYAPDGTRLLDATPAAPPWAIGADGAVYGLQCDTLGHDGPSRLIAYDAQLTEQWRVELGASCPDAGPAIDAQGRLFFSWYINGATEVAAVQTPSPGLAPTAWPARRRDSRGTAWLK